MGYLLLQRGMTFHSTRLAEWHSTSNMTTLITRELLQSLFALTYFEVEVVERDEAGKSRAWDYSEQLRKVLVQILSSIKTDLSSLSSKSLGELVWLASHPRLNQSNPMAKSLQGFLESKDSSRFKGNAALLCR